MHNYKIILSIIPRVILSEAKDLILVPVPGSSNRMRSFRLRPQDDKKRGSLRMTE